jgi:hypothetical protein
MIYNYEITTGSELSYESISINRDNNQLADYYSNNFNIPLVNRTGTHDFIASLNSQTVVERTPTINETIFEKIYKTDGDFYFKTGESISTIYFDDNGFLSNINELKLIFDLRPTQEACVGTGTSSSAIQNSLMNDLRQKMTEYTGNLTKLNYFLNGQKLHSGSGSYLIINNTGFNYRMQVTGKIFAIPQKQKATQFVKNEADLYGVRFIENETNLYVNGMEQEKNIWIELNTGVTLIRTGLEPKIFQDVYSLESILL